MPASRPTNRTRWPALGPHRKLLVFLDKLREDEGRRTYTAIAAAANLSLSRISEFLTGVAIPSPQVLDILVRAIGGGSDEQEKASDLLRGIQNGMPEHARAHKPVAHGDAGTSLPLSDQASQFAVWLGNVEDGEVYLYYHNASRLPVMDVHIDVVLGVTSYTKTSLSRRTVPTCVIDQAAPTQDPLRIDQLYFDLTLTLQGALERLWDEGDDDQYNAAVLQMLGNASLVTTFIDMRGQSWTRSNGMLTPGAPSVAGEGATA